MSTNSVPLDQVQLSDEDRDRLDQLLQMVQQAITPPEKLTERGPMSVAILANSLWGIAMMASAVAAKYGVPSLVVNQYPTPLEVRG